jgi:hypothetical protein
MRRALAEYAENAMPATLTSPTTMFWPTTAVSSITNIMETASGSRE